MQRPATLFAILAYEGIEPIDIGATYGVLSMARRLLPGLRFFVVAKSSGELRMANGLRLLADYGFADCPPAEVLMVLGGPGWQAAHLTIRRFSHSLTRFTDVEVRSQGCARAA